ncbi:hypothetical protein GSI_05296 [Ganoderma sinense ZZ0214-1]|uniref:Uncharacterized protein n=1 Tax=Ganoderma sinense ZZ0214-1 TaxID=1077348 RepID=A0A2G8SFR7_9APHY|nr:hypothetical protein GSI_05296 [Ganoderma sinense ZZ0214-1]
MSTTDIVYTPPCVECACSRKTCRVRNRNHKCNRCNENDIDCSLRKNVRASAEDIYLPDLISNVEAHMGRADDVYQSITQSQGSLLTLGQDILREVRKMAGGVSRESQHAGFIRGAHDGYQTTQDRQSGYLPDSETLCDPGSCKGGASAGSRAELSPDISGEGTQVDTKDKGKGRKKEKDDADEYVPTSPEPEPSLKWLTRDASKRHQVKSRAIQSDQSDAEPGQPDAKPKKGRTGTARASSITLSESNIAGPSKSVTGKKRSAINVDSSSSESSEDDKSSPAKKRSRQEAEQEHNAKFEMFRAARALRGRRADTDDVVIKTEKL